MDQQPQNPQRPEPRGLDVSPHLNSSALHLMRRAVSPFRIDSTVKELSREIADDPKESSATFERRLYLARSFLVLVSAGEDGWAPPSAAVDVARLINAMVTRDLVVSFMGVPGLNDWPMQFQIGDGRVGIFFNAHLNEPPEKLPDGLEKLISHAAEGAPLPEGLTDLEPFKPLWVTPEGGRVAHPIPDAGLVQMADHQTMAPTAAAVAMGTLDIKGEITEEQLAAFRADLESKFPAGSPVVSLGDFSARAQPWRSWDGKVVAVIGIAARPRNGEGFVDAAPERLVIFQWADGRVESMPEWRFRDGRFTPARATVEPYKGSAIPAR